MTHLVLEANSILEAQELVNTWVQNGYVVVTVDHVFLDHHVDLRTGTYQNIYHYVIVMVETQPSKEAR